MRCFFMSDIGYSSDAFNIFGCVSSWRSNARTWILGATIWRRSFEIYSDGTVGSLIAGSSGASARFLGGPAQRKAFSSFYGPIYLSFFSVLNSAGQAMARFCFNEAPPPIAG
jgi:hypothetical protein